MAGGDPKQGGKPDGGVPAARPFSDKKTEPAWRDPAVEGEPEIPAEDAEQFSFSNQPTAEWRAPQPEKSPTAEAAEGAERAADIAAARPSSAEELDPWRAMTPANPVEAQTAMEAVAESKRRRAAGPPPSPAGWSERRWLLVVVGAVIVSISGFAAGTLFRAAQKPDSPALPPPVEEGAAPTLEAVVEEPGAGDEQAMAEAAGQGASETAAPVATAEGAAAPAADELPAGEEGRKALRKQLFEAFAQKEYEQVLLLAALLESDFRIDWEAEYTRAEAVRLTGDLRGAVAQYEAYARKYPRNAKADDARFWAGEILRLSGDLAGAKKHFQAVANNSRSNLRATAKRRLRGLR